MTSDIDIKLFVTVTELIYLMTADRDELTLIILF